MPKQQTWALLNDTHIRQKLGKVDRQTCFSLSHLLAAVCFIEKDEWRNRWFKISKRFKSGKWISIGHCLRLSCFMSFQVVLMTNVWLWFWMWSTCRFFPLNLSCSNCIICPCYHLSFFPFCMFSFCPFPFEISQKMFVSHSLSCSEIYQLFRRWQTGINI